MKKIFHSMFMFVTMGLATQHAAAADFDVRVPMQDKGVATFYVPGQIQGVGEVEFMVDTGSGYTTINEETLSKLQNRGEAEFVKELTGVLADGSEMVVPVYSIRQMSIGNNCTLENVEAAVFPGKTRQILGLSALSRAAPFIFSVKPAELVLSNCTGATT